ncbi:hypothetical protein FOZ61_000426 [Perkinsus olseni]|uniref:Protein arginine methyltransferase 10 n=1 Tax=Perkinsus olseni TaxID=32597 RepID=A0A7J6KWG3_PEROL|nr:hypothetical protein FOZ61_000426 [Perkinsus olseni]KAF4651450.1 hypothetical protein FOL46_000312 [Perkinsus olseni]
MLFRLSAIASVFSASLAGDLSTADGMYCGSGKYWSSLMFIVNSTDETLIASGIANLPYAAPWYLSNISIHMNELGDEIVIGKAPKTREPHSIGGFGYRVPSWTQVNFDVRTQTISATYKDTEMRCTPDQCPEHLPSPHDDRSSLDGFYCCSSKYWRDFFFRVDAADGTLDISGMATLPNSAPFYLSGIPFSTAKDGTVIELGVNGHQSRALRHTIGGFGYPVPSWTTLPFDANTKTITATYRGEKINCTPEQC